MTTSFSVLYDACVLYPAPLRDFLMELAVTDLFRAKWTDRIHEEWIGNLLEKRKDLTRERLERTRIKMNSNVRDCLVDGYEFLIESLDLPDPNDRHVVAAAIHSRCDVIVTYNLKHFPQETLSRHKLEAQHPDQFIAHLLDLDRAVVCQAAREHRARLRQPPKTVEEYLETLKSQQLTVTASSLHDMRGLI